MIRTVLQPARIHAYTYRYLGLRSPRVRRQLRCRGWLVDLLFAFVILYVVYRMGS